MAYARFGEEGSDVYVVRNNRFECNHRDGSGFYFDDLPAILRHLEEEHVLCGETVPQSCRDRIKAEINGQDPLKYGRDSVAKAMEELGLKD